MALLYNLGIHLYSCAVKVSTLFNSKAKLFEAGRKGIFKKLHEEITTHNKLVWIHAASSGEFEQARPIIELLKEKQPEVKILVSFFSPSGYEMHKNYTLADYIFYLPLDTPSNARRWVQLVKPTIALFMKYEFWHNYINELDANKIPVYSVSCIFRDKQTYFKSIGKEGRKALHKITHFFTQDVHSQELLKSIGITCSTTIGDTRFDRVYKITQEKKSFPLIEQFTENSSTIIAGSTWAPDEDLLLKFINNTQHSELKLILVPHEIHAAHIEAICQKIKVPYTRYTKATPENIQESKVLILDKMGMLSSIYRYGEVAYIGGGFGVGIHNILEAACYGIPVMFGPNYKKFKEARDLISTKAGISISDYEQLESNLNELLSNNQRYKDISNNAKQYVEQNRGATEKLYAAIVGNLEG